MERVSKDMSYPELTSYEDEIQPQLDKEGKVYAFYITRRYRNGEADQITVGPNEAFVTELRMTQDGISVGPVTEIDHDEFAHLWS